MGILNLKVHAVKGKPWVQAGAAAGPAAVVSEVAGFASGKKGWVSPALPLRAVAGGDLKQYLWETPGHGLRLDQVSQAVKTTGKALAQSALWANDPGDVWGPTLAALWLAGHVPMVLSSCSFDGKLRGPLWQIPTPFGPKWTSPEGKWVHWQWRGLHCAAWAERVYSEQDLTDRRCGFGKLRHPRPADLARVAEIFGEDPRDLWEEFLEQDDLGDYLNVADWPLLALPTRRLDYLLGECWVHGPTLQAMRQMLAFADVREEWAQLGRYEDAGAGKPMWLGADTERECFFPTAHYLPATPGDPGRGDVLVADGTAFHNPRPAALGTPVWLATAGGEAIDQDPAPESLSKRAAWLFDHADRDGNVGAADRERWEKAGADYALAPEEREGPAWTPRRYDHPQWGPVNALKDGLVIVNWLTKLADDAESGWLLDRRSRKARHKKAAEGLAEWRGRVTKPLLVALSAGGAAGVWLKEELLAQRDRCLKALGRTKAPRPTMQQRVDDLLTDLAYSWQSFWATTGGPAVDAGGEAADLVREWHTKVGLEVGLLLTSVKTRRVLAKALRQAEEQQLFPTEGLLGTARRVRKGYYAECLASFVDEVIAWVAA